MTSRRTFLRSAGAVGTIGLLAGCSQDGGGSGDGESGGSTDTEGSGGESTETDTETATETATPFGNGEIDFNVSPSVAQERLEEQYAPIRDYLSNELGHPANMNLANNYSAVIQALGSGTSDVAETGPFAAALGAMSDNAEIILQRKGFGSWTYVSGIATAPDSDIEELSQLEGKTVAFADRLSTSGALYPLYNIKTEGGLEIGNLPEGGGMNADFEAVFTGGHTASYETLSSGQADAAAMGGFVPGIVDNWEENAQWIQQQEGLPRAPIVVSPQLSEENKNAVQQAFLDAPAEIYLGSDGEEGTDDDLWFNDVREAGVETYQSVIDVANELDVGTEIFEQ
jgi:phosphonate transport system substrate-binding protein